MPPSAQRFPQSLRASMRSLALLFPPLPRLPPTLCSLCLSLPQPHCSTTGVGLRLREGKSGVNSTSNAQPYGYCYYFPSLSLSSSHSSSSLGPLSLLLPTSPLLQATQRAGRALRLHSHTRFDEKRRSASLARSLPLGEVASGNDAAPTAERGNQKDTNAVRPAMMMRETTEATASHFQNFSTCSASPLSEIGMQPFGNDGRDVWRVFDRQKSLVENGPP